MRGTEDQFNRSKKTHRTPPKNKGEGCDKLDVLLRMKQKIKTEQTDKKRNKTKRR